MTYTIIDFEDVTQEIIDDCVQDSFDTLRHSLSGTDRVILKYHGENPSWVASLELATYTKQEMRDEIRAADWAEPVE